MFVIFRYASRISEWTGWGYYIYRYDMISMKCSGMPPGVLEGQDGETKEMCYD